ncbi:MAG: hypothetical protein IJQ91_04895 [Acidaminococcaceae bacterium]|nr:hypothetical protein [Acidaminococcaceae bacterium]
MMFQDFDLKTKKLLLLFLSCLLAWWLLGASATVSASAPEPMYQISETQLSMLETRLDLLDQILAQQNPELTTLQLQLVESKKELATLRSELTISKEQLTKAEESLRNANLYLEKCAAEEKKKRLKIKAQRNGYFVCMVAAIIAACHK